MWRQKFPLKMIKFKKNSKGGYAEFLDNNS
jgi:hypothetical protein